MTIRNHLRGIWEVVKALSIFYMEENGLKRQGNNIGPGL
jgi:hypothetical protein